MKRTTFSVLYNLKPSKSKKKEETMIIYARITVNGERVELSIQRTVEKALWDFNKGCAKGISTRAKELNNYLEHVNAKLREHKIKMEEQNIPITAPGIRDLYLGIDDRSKTIVQIFKEHNLKFKQLADVKDVSAETLERYETCLRHVESMIKFKYNKRDIPLNEITPMFVDNFEHYLKTQRGCCHNTTVKYIKNFKKIIRIALTNGWLKKDPFLNKKYHLDDVDMEYLTKTELDVIMKKEIKNKRLQAVRDIYVFCCFTALSYIDVKQLYLNEIEEVDGHLWIKKRRQKTKNKFRVPLLPPAVKIMNTYNTNPICVDKGVVLPVLSNQKMNVYLRELSELCKINKHLSMHTARHTFATTIALANNVPLEIIAEILGHSSSVMTRRYARFRDDIIKQNMDNVFEIYKEAI